MPILKCRHRKSGYECDLNFSNYFGVLNSTNLKHLLSFDIRIRPLATIIKCWMKLHECSGTNRISNYAILWMLLFYLQTLPEPIVPPIVEFQQNISPYIIRDYNFAFDYSKQNTTLNKMTVYELLHGFFEFYKDFDFQKYIICPLYGRYFEKEDVRKNNLPEFKKYNEILANDPERRPLSLNKPLCIQDPFETTLSIPGLISMKSFKYIVLKLRLAAEIADNFLKAKETDGKLLVQLFDMKRFQEFVNQNKETKARRKRKKAQASSSQSENGPAEKIKSSNDDTLSDSSSECDEEQKLPAQDDVKQSENEKKIVATTQENEVMTIAKSKEIVSGRPLTKITFTPNESMLFILRHILRSQNIDENNKIDSTLLHQEWTRNVIRCIIEMFQNIFKFTLQPSSDDVVTTKELEASHLIRNLKIDVDQPLAFDIIGTRDVFYGRKQLKDIDGNTFGREVKISHKFFESAMKIHLKAQINIYVKRNRFDCVDVEIDDKICTKKNNHYKTFCATFKQISSLYLKAYFAQCAEGKNTSYT